MNKLLVIIGAAVTAVFTGCKSVPTTDGMYTTANAIGVSAGMVANLSKIDDQSRNVVVDIINEVDQCIPQTNQTFEAAWTPVAEAHTAKLIEDGKITKEQAVLILKAFNLAVCGIDYLFDVRYPKARQYQDLVEAAVHGFTDGFLTVFKPVNTFGASNGITFDAPAYNYLLSTSYTK